MKIRNWSLLITLSALACFFYFYITPQYLHPAEDATILFSYAENWAKSGVISYCPGGPKVDGSTDFLFLSLITAGIKYGWEAYQSALMVTALATMLLMFFVYRLLDTRFISTQYLVLGLIFFSQQIWAAVLGYGTLLYAMTLAYLAVTYWKGKMQHFAFASTLAFIARPDAAITILPLLAHKLFADKLPVGRKMANLLLLFILPVAAYLSWRYLYFGRILPLSFDINTTNGQEKILGIIIPYSFHYVKGYAIYYLWPGLLGLFLYFLKEKFKVQTGYYVLIMAYIVLPMAAYMCVRENLDFSHRYFIGPYLGLVMVSGLIIRNKKSIIISLFGLILLGKTAITSFEQGLKSLHFYYNNTWYISEELSALPKATLATSEAGILAWKSGFTTYDLWGLNTAEFTAQLPSPERIVDLHADLMVLHAGKPEYRLADSTQLTQQKNWQQLSYRTVMAMQKGAYEVYEVPFDTRMYRKQGLSDRGLLQAFFKWLSEINREPVSKRTDLYAIQKDSPLAPAIKQILLNHGGKPFDIVKGE